MCIRDRPEVLKPEVARQIQELLDLGFIEPSNSEMASPIVCVLKGQVGENVTRKCHVYWCYVVCITLVAYTNAICHKVPCSYNASGILADFSDSNLHLMQSTV